MTYCPHDGWEEHDTEQEARDHLEGIVEHLRDEANSDGWFDDAGQARAFKITEIAGLVLRESASCEDDSPEGGLCRERGWDFLWDGVIVDAPKEGVSLIAAERLRQVSAEGWTPEHDDEHAGGSLVEAAVAYARYGDTPRFNREVNSNYGPPACWPWHPSWWKPASRIRSLVKAGALIAAEIDRLIRAET